MVAANLKSITELNVSYLPRFLPIPSVKSASLKEGLTVCDLISAFTLKTILSQ